VARRARIAGDGTYRISGHMGSCEEFVLQVKLGATQSGGAGIALEVAASELGLGPGDDIDIVLSRTQPDDLTGIWLELDPEASFVHIRDYYFDWQPTEPGTFVIERLDTQGQPRQLVDGADVLEAAIHEIEHSVAFWSGYQERMLGDQPVNTFGVPTPGVRGVQGVHYSHAGLELKPDEALVVDVDHAGAPLWDIQLYNRPWYEALDFTSRLSVLNHAMAEPGPIVIAGTDPGGVNWLDTQGRERVLCTLRWWRAPADPTVQARVVPLADLDLPAIDRREQIRRRAAHIAWRYRS
jgi:hypothetical protein